MEMTTPRTRRPYSEVKQLRDQGYSLQAIGDKFGLTKERIRQILKERYGTTRMLGLTPRDLLAQLLGCSNGRLILLEKGGVLRPIHVSGCYLYNRDEAEKAAMEVMRPRAPDVEKICEECGKKFYARPYKINPHSPHRFCSRVCQGRYAGLHYGIGVHGKHWAGHPPAIEKECIGCGAIHTRRGLFCSIKCYDRIRALVRYYEGERQGGTKRIKVHCSACGAEIERMNKGHRHFCNEHLREYRRQVGERLKER